jgi:hypothetical protein
MKPAIGLLCLALFLSACGNSGSPAQPAPKPGAPIDPSGNWTMTAADTGNHSEMFSALFAQTGSVVTANSFLAPNNPVACTPFSATLSNGSVQNVSNFTGDVTFGNNLGGFTFNTTLAADGKSFTGTYANMPGCAGVLATGTFTGAEVPTTSGTWTGTLQPCNYDQTTGICTLVGVTSPLSASLTQNDQTGSVNGTYTVSGVAGFSSGTISIVPPFDILSGTLWQFTVNDTTGSKATVCGGCTLGANGSGLSGLDLKGDFAGLLTVGSVGTPTYYWLVASH